jgi:hypothetical protein
MSDNELPIAEAVQQQLALAQQEAEASFGRGYAQGRQDQLKEDQYYIERVAELSRLLSSAEHEIQRLRAR